MHQKVKMHSWWWNRKKEILFRYFLENLYFVIFPEIFRKINFLISSYMKVEESQNDVNVNSEWSVPNVIHPIVSWTRMNDLGMLCKPHKDDKSILVKVSSLLILRKKCSQSIWVYWKICNVYFLFHLNSF